MPLQPLTGPQDPSSQNFRYNSLISAINAASLVTGADYYAAPLAADLIYIKAAATPANGLITLAHQPDYPRKLQIRIVLGTPGTTNITAGTLTIVGTNLQGQTVSEVISLVTAVSVTLTSVNAYANITSGTVANYAASGGGTGNTLGVGQSAFLALSLPPNWGSFTVNKENVTNADEAIGTIDYVSGSISPTSAPNGTLNFQIFWTANTAE